MSKFPLGQIVSTPAALDAAMRLGDPLLPSKLIARHASGDWGDVGPEDRGMNDAALTDGDRIMSVYKVKSEKFWLITEHDRSVTTLLLPSDY